MFETLLFIIVGLIVVALLLQNAQKNKQINKQLEEVDRVTSRTRAMCASGEHLNKKKAMLMEVHGAHVASLEKESNIWSAKRRDYEAVIHKKTNTRKKIRGKKRKGH